MLHIDPAGLAIMYNGFAKGLGKFTVILIIMNAKISKSGECRKNFYDKVLFYR